MRPPRSLRDITTNTCARARALIKRTLTCLHDRDARRRADGCALTAAQHKRVRGGRCVDGDGADLRNHFRQGPDPIDRTSPRSSRGLQPSSRDCDSKYASGVVEWTGLCFQHLFSLLPRRRISREDLPSLLPVLTSIVPCPPPPVSEPVRVLAAVPLWYCPEWIHGEEHQEELPGNAPVHGEIPSDRSPGRSR